MPGHICTRCALYKAKQSKKYVSGSPARSSLSTDITHTDKHTDIQDTAADAGGNTANLLLVIAVTFS